MYPESTESGKQFCFYFYKVFLVGEGWLESRLAQFNLYLCPPSVKENAHNPYNQSYIHTYNQTYIQAYIHITKHTYNQAYIQSYIHRNILTYNHAYIQPNIQPYIHTYTKTGRQMDKQTDTFYCSGAMNHMNVSLWCHILTKQLLT